ncbi:MBL fold metallo-hydrolase [uncultured Ruegeria sp.]|uniref:MBL fold metallo-hydrolase n=1 Tax=uncultured Ruegeria sp. TaxID=259304 RepID=UPI00262B19A7|nr:MBL fold metallo-hydrolase [uncultured Ruegeria sp.]
MKLHFANSAFISAPERAVQPGGRWRTSLGLRVRYGILVHPRHGPVLIDTGYSEDIFEGPRSFGLRAYAAAFGPVLAQDGQTEVVLNQLGFAASDVSKIIITHFHADHVSALRRFPQAEIITDLSTLTTILNRGGFTNLRHGIFPELLPHDLLHRVVDIAKSPIARAPLTLGIGRDLFEDGSVIAIDLPGHAEGHFGLCFPQLDPVLLYACDVQWVQAALAMPRQLPLLGRIVSQNKRDALRSSRKVAEFQRAGGTALLCHDPALTPFDLEQLPND